MSTTSRTTERPIALRRRHDLVVAAQRYGDRRYWVVKDPLSLRFVRLREPEFALFESLDGRHSLGELVSLFETKFAPQRIRPEELSRFIAMLHHHGLLISERPGQAEQLQDRGRRRRRRQFWTRWLSPLTIRFPGIDPTPVFNLLYPLARPLFSRVALVCGLLFILSAVLLIGAEWQTFAARIPTFHEFFVPSNLLVLTVVLGGVKVLHELGHGLACRHFGGECRDLGLMLLVFTPCLYCDVTDAWRFTNKWQRAAVGAAGMYVELLLASAATFVWWFSEPGLLHQVCLGVMVVASVSTLVLNGNPLMRYDGYYILCDLLEVPNLGERSASVVRQEFSRHVLGADAADDPLAPTRHRGWYLLYAIASGIYRWTIVVSIILILVEAARPWRLENLSRLLGILLVAAPAVAAFLRIKHIVNTPTTRERMNRSRVGVLAGLLVIGLAALFIVPVPHHLFGPLELQPRDAEPVYVEVSGRVVESPVRYGTALPAGAVVARLENRDVDLAIEELTARRDRYQADLTSLRRQKFDSPTAGLVIPHTEKLLESLEGQLHEKLRDRARLTPVVVRGGTLFPPSATPEPRGDDEHLAAWSGHPLDTENLGCTVEVGSLLGQIGDPNEWQAAVVLDQEDVEFVRVGDEVEVLLDAFPEEVLHGRVEEIALGELRESPQRLSNKVGGEVATQSDAAGTERPISTSYLVRVHLQDPTGRLRIGGRGTARIQAAAMPLGVRLVRRLSRTFYFDL